MRGLCCFFALTAALLPARLHAVTVVPMTFEQLVSESAAVVYARVAGVRGQWTGDRRAIDSVITLEALQYFKGDLGAAVSMRLPGGEAGGVRNVIPGGPVVREGELVVLFLKSRGPALLTTLGLTQGLFRVARDPRSGTMRVTPPPLKESPAGRILRGAADRRNLSLIEFGTTVREMSAR